MAKRQVYKYYKIENGKIIVTKKVCPKCGNATYMAEHKDRWHCGKCGYTEFKNRKTIEVPELGIKIDQ